MESEKEPHKNACTVSFRRADFSIAARLGRLVAMGMGATWELIRYPALWTLAPGRGLAQSRIELGAPLAAGKRRADG